MRMIRQSSRVYYAAVFLCLLVSVMFLVKPRELFDDDGQPRHFGLAYGNTLMSIGTLTFVTAGGLLFLFAWIDMVCV